MPTIEKFEDLRIWQESRELVCHVYITFSKGTDSEKDFVFRDQIKRASISIMNNISK